MPELTFLFKSGRKERLESDNEFPTEFFYGYPQLISRGIQCAIYDERDLGLLGRGFLFRAVTSVGWRLSGLPLAVIFRLLFSGWRKKFTHEDILVATTTTFGLALAAIKAMGLVRAQIVFLAMGICDEKTKGRHRWFYQRVLRHVTVATLSKGDQAFLQDFFGDDIRVAYLQFGVDQQFWVPDIKGGQRLDKKDQYVLSIGNDLHRDYATLIKAWKPHFPELRIITKLPVPPSPENVKIIHGDWRSQVLSDSEIRTMFRKALFVVLPIRQTYQPSGQSACLQAMSCGKTVIISDIKGLWDRAGMVSGESCL
ncbi:MAG: hypothetical protein KAJ90_06930, partial [Desulfobacterales bacterium]|nr:hypothetical protein [Desulfobacterales bacterium]